MKQETITKTDYLVVFLLLFISGNPLSEHFFGKFSALALLIFVVAIILYKRVKLCGNAIVLAICIGVYVLLCMLQLLWLRDFSVMAYIRQGVMLLCGFYCMSFLGIKFRYAYLRIITFLAAVSILMFALQMMGLTFGITVSHYRTIGIYNALSFDNYSIIQRNCGMFWEPGAYQGYLILVPLFFIDNLKQLWISERKSCIAIAIALITTYSTTGFVVTFIVVGLSAFHEIKNSYVKILSLVGILLIGTYTFSSLDFLGDKISTEIQDAQQLSTNDASWTRMGAMKIDLANIARHPIIGNGFSLSSRYGSLGEQMSGSGNGFTGAMNTFGIPVIILYLFGVFKASAGRTVYQRLIVALAIVLCLNGEYFLNYPLYWALLFLQVRQKVHIQYSNKKPILQ